MVDLRSKVVVSFRRSVALCMLTLCTELTAHELQFEPLQLRDGLPDPTVTSIVQDTYGFLWFATVGGAVRYDGYASIVFVHDPLDSSTISSNAIYAMVAGSDGEVWISTENGLNRFNPITHTFRRYMHDPMDSSTVCHNTIRALCRDRRGYIWVGTTPAAHEKTTGGVCRLDPRTDKAIHFKHDPHDPSSLSDNSVLAIVEDRQGAIWVGTSDGLNALDVETGRIQRFLHHPFNRMSLSGDWIASLLVDSQGTLWIGTDGLGLNRIDHRAGGFQHYKADPRVSRFSQVNDVRTMLELDSTTLLIGTKREGLFVFNKLTGRFKHFKHNPRNPRSLASNNVISTYRDNSGVTWVSTLDAGVAKVKPLSPTMQHYDHDPEIAGTLSHNFVRSLYEDSEGTVWVGTMGGLNALVPPHKTVRRFMSTTGDPNSLSHDVVHATLEDGPHTLWVATLWGLNRLDKESGRFKHYKHDPRDSNSISHNNVFSLARDEHGTLWVGTRKGLDRYEHELDHFIRVPLDPEEVRSMHHSDVACLSSDGKGSIWFLQDGKLRQLNISTGRVETHRLFQSEQNIVSSRSMICRGPELWIATYEMGLLRFEISSGSVTTFGLGQGWLTNTHIGLGRSSVGYFWVATNRGIARFDPRSGEVKSYDKGHDLTSTHYDAIGVLRNGSIVAGGEKGVDLFHPDHLSVSAFQPPVYITEFRVFEEPLKLPSWLPTTQVVRLDHDENFFSLRFASLDFTEPELLEYRYKLEGLDADWVEARARNHAGYTNIPPGEYMFKVRGTNYQGVWSEHEASLTIVITPPWWKTTWAYAGYAVVAIGLLYSIGRFEKNRERLRHLAELEHVEAEKLREVDQLKSRFFANISHEFRTPLTLIEGPVKQLRSGEYKGDPSEQYNLILRNSHRLLQLVNQLLDLSKIESGEIKLRVREFNIVELVKGVAAAFESLARQNGIEFKVNCTDESIIGWFDRDAVEKIVTNLLTNAFKFTAEGGAVTLSLRGVPQSGTTKQSAHEENQIASLPTVARNDMNETVHLTVSDTGVGIPVSQLDKIFDRFYQVDDTQTREHEGTGIGLALTKELVELHKGEITVTSEVGKGTTFTVRLALSQEHGSTRPDEERRNSLTMTGLAELRHPERASLSESKGVPGNVETPASRPVGRKEEEYQADGDLPLLLIIEDNADMRTYMRTHLDDKYRVTEAVNGEAGLQKAIEIVPDLIISDVMMPKMDGFMLCEKLKTDERTSHVPIILLTAKMGAEHMIEGLDIGADDYVTKPFDSRELLVRVKNIIDQRRKLREKFRKEGTFRLKEMTITSADERFMNRVMEVIKTHISDQTFSVELFANEMYLSRMQLHRKIRALTDLSPWQFVRKVRLQRAADLLRKHVGNVSDIAFQIGYDSPSRFAEAFRQEFGQTPSDYESGTVQS